MENYEIIMCGFILISALIMTGIYIRTKRPKLYALGGALTGGLVLVMFSVFCGIEINFYNSALSAVLGIPGAVTIWIITVIWG